MDSVSEMKDLSLGLLDSCFEFGGWKAEPSGFEFDEKVSAVEVDLSAIEMEDSLLTARDSSPAITLFLMEKVRLPGRGFLAWWGTDGAFWQASGWPPGPARSSVETKP